MYKNMYDCKNLLENDLQHFDKKSLKSDTQQSHQYQEKRTTKVNLLPQIIEQLKSTCYLKSLNTRLLITCI